MDERVLDEMGWVRVFRREHGVSMEGYGVRLDLGCREALTLCNWLMQHRAFLVDRVSNFYECRECGGVHHQLVRVCPSMGQGEDR